MAKTIVHMTNPQARLTRVALVVLLVSSVLAPSASSQALKNSESLELSGLIYMDYAYVLQEADGSAGDNGFSSRRLYLTSDYKLNSDMRVRARLEAGANGEPFMKDLYFRWDNSLAEDHRLTIGISSPPAFSVSEGFLGYRSLEKTILDRDKIVSSRDFGVKLSGPLGSLKYAVMFANNEGQRSEDDRQKRVYGQIEANPSERIQLTVGADYAALEDGSSITTNAFIGYRMDRVRVGVEGYFNPIRPDEGDGADRVGVSVFGAAAVGQKSELVARYDFSSIDTAVQTDDGSFAMLGLAMTVRDNVRFIPNLLVDTKVGADDSRVTGRVTLHVDF
ncbi:MAG: hypothetical protein ACI9W4_001600 [Rhodothermales bacterium]